MKKSIISLTLAVGLLSSLYATTYYPLSNTLPELTNNKVNSPIDIEVKTYEVKIKQPIKYLKVSNEEYRIIMKHRYDNNEGFADKIEMKKINSKFDKVFYLNNGNIIAETIENNVFKYGIDLKNLYEDFRKKVSKENINKGEQ